MEPKEIMFDLDDVIKPLAFRWIAKIKEKMGIDIIYDDIHSFQDLAPYLHLLAPEHFDHEYGLPEHMAQYVINRIVELGHKVYVVSATHHSNIPAKTNWLKKFMPMIEERNFIWTYKKELLAQPKRILVDDATHNLIAFRERGGTALAFDRPWNKDWDGYRVNSFSDLDELIWYI